MIDEGTLIRTDSADAIANQISMKWDMAKMTMADGMGFAVFNDGLTDSKAIVRFIFPEHFTLKVGDSPQRMFHVVLGFLEHVLQVLSSTPQPGRYIGHAVRAEPRFGQQMYNQHYEFALEHD